MWNLNFYYRVYKIPQTGPYSRPELSSPHKLYSFDIHFNIIILSVHYYAKYISGKVVLDTGLSETSNYQIYTG